MLLREVRPPVSELASLGGLGPALSSWERALASDEAQFDGRLPTHLRQSQTFPLAGIGAPSTQFCNPALSIFLGCQKQVPDSGAGFHHCSGLSFQVLVVSEV